LLISGQFFLRFRALPTPNPSQEGKKTLLFREEIPLLGGVRGG